MSQTRKFDAGDGLRRGSSMEKRYYVIAWREEYLELLRTAESVADPQEQVKLERVLVAILQGGFGEGVIDYQEQVKERFLEYEFSFRGLGLPCTAATFDRYFMLEEPTDFIDLDETS